MATCRFRLFAFSFVCRSGGVEGRHLGGKAVRARIIIGYLQSLIEFTFSKTEDVHVILDPEFFSQPCLGIAETNNAKGGNRSQLPFSLFDSLAGKQFVPHRQISCLPTAEARTLLQRRLIG